MSGDHNMYGDGTVYRPLTEEEIYKMHNALWRAGGTEAVAFARAIERAHGIGEKP